MNRTPSQERTSEALGQINASLRERYFDGEPYTLKVTGVPTLKIDSFEPLVYSSYGTFRNRAPRIAGEAALRALIHRDLQNGNTQIYAGLATDRQAYGAPLNDIEIMQQIAIDLGHDIDISR